MGINYRDDIMEITVKDGDSTKTGCWRFNISNKPLGKKIFSFLQRKYGFDSSDKTEEKEEKETVKKEIDWLDMDVEW
jgi:hypothetical protein